MKRTTLTLAVAAAAAPLLLSGALPASAATTSGKGTLTVTTLNRSGKAVATKLVAVNLTSDNRYTLTSGKASTLPKGSYDVLAHIVSGGTGTFGALRITVGGTAKATLDARKGKRITVALTPAPSKQYTVDPEHTACVMDDGVAVGEVDDIGQPNLTSYVIPASISDVEFDFAQGWSRGIDGAVPTSPTAYLLGGNHKHGLPTGVGMTVSTAKLARLTINAHSGQLPAGKDDFNVQAREETDDCGTNRAFADPMSTGNLPGTLHYDVQPGSWGFEADTDAAMVFTTPHTYTAGAHSVTFGKAVWGPLGSPATLSGGSLQLNLGDLFDEPGQSDPQGFDTWGSAKVAVQLRSSTRTLLNHSYSFIDGYEKDLTLPGTGWYTLGLTANRTLDVGKKLPAGSLYTWSSYQAHFDVTDLQADQVAPGWTTQFKPAGLDSRNRAKARSSTTVTLGFSRARWGSDSAQKVPGETLAKVQTWYSTDLGKTWHAVSVKHSGSAWSVAVKNPGSGYVSLRTEVTDTHGNTATTSVIRAYAIG